MPANPRIKPAENRKRLLIALGLSATYMVAEAIGGMLTGSLALLADAGHMLTDGAAIGQASMSDFRLLAGVVARLSGGVYLNVGSAVILPEVFVKALNVARNLGGAEALLGNRKAARANYQNGLSWATSIRYRPEIALSRFELSELLFAEAKEVSEADSNALWSEAQAHLDFAIDEFHAMKMQPVLERALSLKNSLR